MSCMVAKSKDTGSAVSFTEAERDAMMDSFRNASKNTMFEQWLDATKQPPPDAIDQQKAVQADKEAAKAPRKEPPKLQDLVQYLADDNSGKVDPQTAAKARYALLVLFTL